MSGNQDAVVLRHDLVFRLVSFAHAAMLLFFAAPGWTALREVDALDPAGLSGNAWLFPLVALWSLAMLVLAVWWLAFVWTFAIRVDATGVSQGWALRRQRIPWQAIASVEVEVAPEAQTDTRKAHPRITLRDAQGRWLMQVRLGQGTAPQKQRFIEFVVGRVPQGGVASGATGAANAGAIEVRVPMLSRALMVLWPGTMAMAYPIHVVFRTVLRPGAAMDATPVLSWIFSGVLFLLAVWLWWYVGRTKIRADATGLALQTATASHSFDWQQVAALWQEMPEDGRARQLLPYIISAAPSRAIQGWCEFGWSLVYAREGDELIRFVQEMVEQQGRLHGAPAPADPQSYGPLEFRHPL